MRPALALAVAAMAVVLVESAPVWRSFDASLRSIDFDAGRAALIEAWVAGALLALLAAALTGRPWISTLTATTFVMVNYATPWAWKAAHAATRPFAPPPHLDPLGLIHNLGVIAAVALLVAVPAAATGWLVRSGLTRPLPVRPAPHAVMAGAAMVLLLCGAGAVAAGVDPLLRYGPDHGLYAAGSNAPAGRVVYRGFESHAMGTHRNYAVYLPPAYSTRSSHTYPVVYLLHGNPGSYKDWVNLGAPQILNDGIQGQHLSPAILVMPDGNGTSSASSQWANSIDGRDPVESSVLELVAQVDHDYRTVPDSHSRFVAGLSEGGFGAANLAARHPDVFGAAISLSGYFSAQGAVFGGDQAYMDANSPAYLIQHRAAARGVQYVLVAGRDDPRYRAAAQAFDAQLSKFGVAHQLLLLPGGHEGFVWTNGLAAGLERLVPPSRPGATPLGLGAPLSLIAGLLPLGALVSINPKPIRDRSKRAARTAAVRRSTSRAGGWLRQRAVSPMARGLLTLVAVADVLLATEAWLAHHHAVHPAVGLALAPLAPLRVLVGGSLASVALYMASRSRKSFRYLLVGLAAAGGIVAITASRPLLIIVAGADCLLVLAAGSLWPKSSHLRSSVAGWVLLGSAAVVTTGLFMLQHPNHKLASVTTMALVMAFAAAVSGLTLLDRNAQMPTHQDPRRARELHDETAGAGVSPFALVGRKRHFWARDGSALLAYGCRGGVALGLGPALGTPEASARLHERFRAAARERGWRPALYQVSGHVARELGWGHRYLLGSEAMVDLSTLGLEGPARASLRRDVARGRRGGVQIEVVPDGELDEPTEAAMARLAESNSRHRRLGEMSFSVGRRRDRCQARRTVCIARDPAGALVAYTTWLWLPAARTVVLDEVQRDAQAPPGTMDLLLWSSLDSFRPEADRASLGLAPIAGSHQAQRLARIEAFARRRLRIGGIAPGLYSFKAKFGPSWEPRYLVAERWLDWPSVWLAVFMLHFPKAMSGWVQPQPLSRSATKPA